MAQVCRVKDFYLYSIKAQLSFRQAGMHICTSPSPTITRTHVCAFPPLLQGVMMLPKAALPGSEPDACALYKRLWIHEALRVFYDRLVDEADREWLLDQVCVCVYMCSK
eukprot:scaffold62127_cov23-Tisochrysis_lutea.AAC.1